MSRVRVALTLSAVVRESLASVVREMRRAMVRSSYSSIIYEGYDFSCVLTDSDGNLVAESGEDHPFHIIPIAGAVAGMTAVHAALGTSLGEADMVLHNDPYTGGTHLNDVALIWPVYDEGMPAFYIVIRPHWGDIGGMSPGSLNGAASEILQEGLRLNYIRLPKQAPGEALRMIFDNVRAQREAAADFAVVTGICRLAEQRLRKLIGKYGPQGLRQAMRDVLNISEQRLRCAIGELPDGVWRHTAYLDGAAATGHPLQVSVTLTIVGNSIHADFAGSSPQVPAPLNAGPAIAPTSVLTVVKSFLDPSGPINSGSLRAISVNAPSGTIVNATSPAPCGGLNEVRFACDAAVMGALAQVIPNRLIGDVRGTSNHTYIGSSAFIFYEYPSGGTGGRADSDGAVALRAFNEGENVSIQSAEMVEAMFPLRILRTQIRPDSGGAGRMRGGCGLLREVEINTEGARLSVLSDRNIVPPAGVNGGRSGAPNRYRLRREGCDIAPSSFPGKIANFALQPGDVLVMESSGGGGYGNPLEREASRFADDLADGYVTKGGVARYRHLPFVPTIVADDSIVAPSCRLSAPLANALGARLGSLVELVFASGPSRRFWVGAIDAAAPDEMRISRQTSLPQSCQGIYLLAKTTPFCFVQG